MKPSRSSEVARVALVLALLSFSAPAVGQPKPGTPEAAKQADALFVEGKTLLKSGKKREARDKYLAALALKKSYDVAGNLGSLEVDLGLYREAAEHLSYALKTYSTSGSTPEQIEKARQRLAEAKKHVGTLSVTVNVEGAAVFVDGVSVGRAPLPDELFVEAGSRVIEAKLAGFEDAKRSLDVVKGSTQEVALTLAALPGVGGPKVITPLEPGGDGEVKPPGETKLVGGPSKPLVIAGIATSATLIGAGVVFAIISSVKGTDAETQRTALLQEGGGTVCEVPTTLAARCSEFNSTARARDAFGSASVWSLIAGGAIGAGTAVYALAAPKKTVRAAITLGPGSAGLLVSGIW